MLYCEDASMYIVCLYCFDCPDDLALMEYNSNSSCKIDGIFADNNEYGKLG